MTIGQMSEIVVLAVIPMIAKTVSRKSLLAVGLLAYGLRMLLFMNGESLGTAAVMLGIALHGLCFGCFIFVAFMIVDEETTPDMRASAQSLFNLVIIGIGIIVGSMIAGEVAAWASEPVLNEAGAPVLDADGAATTAIQYTRLFSIPMWASFVCLAALLLFYPKHSPRRGELASN